MSNDEYDAKSDAIAREAMAISVAVDNLISWYDADPESRAHIEGEWSSLWFDAYRLVNFVARLRPGVPMAAE